MTPGIIGSNVNIISETQFKAYAPDVDLSQFDDPTISGLISHASQQVADYLQFSPVAENISGEIRDGTISPQGDLIIYVAKPPIISVSAVKLTKGSTSVALTLTDGNGNNKYNIDYLGRKIIFPYYEVTLTGIPIFVDFFNLRGTYFFTSVDYRGGFEAYQIPTPIQMATVYVMRDILARQYNQPGASSLHQGQVSMSFSDPFGKSEFIKQAERLLRPYRRIG